MNHIYKRFILGGIALIIIIGVGTFGYWFISDPQESLLNCLYMTVVTITTIGYREVVDISDNKAGILFTILIAFGGIGVLTYTLSYVAALVIEGEIFETYRKKRIEKMVKNSLNHYLICGAGETGLHVADELLATQRDFVLIDKLSQNALADRCQGLPFVQGDATDESILSKAGIMRARGVFAVTNDDNYNLVITVTAKQLNPRVRVVARVRDINSTEKMRKVGADAVVSPTSIGGLRLASEMVRPTVVSFLDTMLRGAQANLRVEEISVPVSYSGKPISALRLHEHRDALLVALRNGEDWVFNPQEDIELQDGSTLILMLKPDVRSVLEKRLARG